MTLKSFPRGGKKPEVKTFSNVLFNQKPTKATRKHKSEIKKQHHDIIEGETNFIAEIADRLSNATICEGMIILGRISEATEYELIVSIPGGLLGCVQVTDLSESYTNLLQNLISENNVQSDEFKSLPDLYNSGDYIVCYVKSVNPDGKWLYSLSLEPQLINQNVSNNYLIKNAKMVCAIKSVEEHGYVVDTGIANVRAFLATKHVNKKKRYFPGHQILCAIKEIKTVDQVSVLTLSAKKKIIDRISTHDVESLDTLTPGTKLSLRITKLLSNGLQVAFGENHVGYINQVYLDNPLSTYVDDTEVTGILLYVMPTVKLAYFSLLSDESEEEKLQVGDIKKVKVLYRESKGIIFKFTKSSLRGFVSLRRTNVSYEKIPTEFKPGSVHRCRILAYNWTEHLYVCTMEKEIMQQKYFSLADFRIGDILTVKSTNVNLKSGFVQVQVGKIYGVVVPEHVSDSGLNALKKLKAGDDIEARVLSIDNDKHNVRFTLKQSLIKSELPVLQDIQEARRGQEYHGTITKISKNGLLVRFYGDVKGWVPRTVLDSNTSDMNWTYTMGQTVRVQIDSMEKEQGKMKLRIVSDEQKQQLPVNVKIGELLEGTVVESSVEGLQLKLCQKDDEDVAVTGFLPAGHMSPCMDIGGLLTSRYTPGDSITAYVFSMQPSVMMSRTYVTQGQYRSFDALTVGDCIPCTIRDISPDGVRVILPVEDCPTFGFVSYKNISNFELLRLNQILFVKITAINKREKQLTLTMALKDVWDSPLEHGVKMLTAVDVLNLYFNKLAELATNVFYKNKPISSVILGQKVTGQIEKITEHGLVLRLDNNLTGIVRKDHYTVEPKIGDKVSGTIMWKNYAHDLVDVSLLPRIVNSISSKQKKLPQLPDTLALRGEILMITGWFILVLVKRNGSGYLVALPVRRHLNDLTPDLTPYVVHAKLRLYIVLKGNESNIMPIGMLKSAFETPKKATVTQPTPSANKTLKRKLSARQDADSTSALTKKPRREVDDWKADDDNVTDQRKLKGKASKVSRKVKAEVKRNSNAKEKSNEKEDVIVKKKTVIKDIDETSEMDEDSEDDAEDKSAATEKSHVPECGFNWDDKPSAVVVNESSSDDEEEPMEEPKRKKKKLSGAERREQEREKEREIRQREEALASNQTPTSVDQFDRLVLSSPNSSLVWIQYMTYHLLSAEIDKARAVAKRAIKTINFRDGNELLNVWNAWLNIESKYGTSESLNDVFQEALKANDAYEVYTRMLNLQISAGRQAEVEKLTTVMTRKFNKNLDTWVQCGTALMTLGLTEKSRNIMQRALQSLPEPQHVNLLVKFANLESKVGNNDRSQTLFTKILSSYPKRVDVWSTYVDSLIKIKDFGKVREVLEQATSQVLPVKKMKTLFKKSLSFEEKYGTPEDVARVQQLAADYVEKQCNKEST